MVVGWHWCITHRAAAEFLPAANSTPVAHHTLNTIVRYPAALVSYAHK